MAKKMLHTKAEVVRKNIDVEQGIVDAVIGSTNVLDRYGDIIDQSGWDIKYYKKTNPVILWGHNMDEDRPPIGKALKVWLQDRGDKAAKLMFKVKFDLQDSFAAEIFRKIKEGFINTVSVGFLPTEWEPIDEDAGPFGGRKYMKQELLELSFVPVPANPEAVIALRSLGKKDKRFNPVELKDLYPDKKKEELEKEKKSKVKGKTKKTPEVEVEVDTDVVKKKTKKVKESKVISTKTDKEEKDSKPEKEEKPEVKKSIKKKKVVKEEPKEEKASKKVIPFKDLDTLPDSEVWDGPGEVAKAEVSDLKLICTWYDSEDADVKGSYKLPHHKAEGHKCVWRGVAAAMAALLGARGGVKIPEGDRKGVYNHLKKHYVQFDKDVPDFKMVEDQVLASLDDEVHALALDREDKYAVRLIKKVLKKQKKEKAPYTEEQLKKALEVINLALSLYRKGSLKGGEKEVA